MMKACAAASFLAALLLPAAAIAQELPTRSAPQAVPIVQAVPDAVDAPYPGVIALDIDATDVQRAVFRVTETIPVAKGLKRLTLLYPQWIPGHHAPRGPIAELADLRFTAGGKPLAWQRDPVEQYAFHVDLPDGASEVVAKFIYTSPLLAAEGRIAVAQEMMNLQWDKISLYPAGHYVRRIRVKPGATFPQGWIAATALDGMSGTGNRIGWAETDYETLVDSPVMAGAYARKWDLGHGVMLNAFADQPEGLAATPEQIALHRAMVEEALLVFGSRHFEHYDFLLAVTEKLGAIGLEHHRSSENQLEGDAFTNWSANEYDRALLPHEFSHSWDGKFRRPAGLWTPDYRQPMQGSLLWVYEGQDQLWGLVLAARSGLQSREFVLATLASYAAQFTDMAGRGWRPLEDTTRDPVFAARKPRPFVSLSRDEDYYREGAMVWLEVDQIIREGTAGRKGIDDFARAFFGIRDGDRGEVTYQFSDVVAALGQLYPYDWAAFFRQRIETPGQAAPVGGIVRGGYRLVWRDEPNAYDRQRMAAVNAFNLANSIGLVLDRFGQVAECRWDSAAFNAGIVNGSVVVAVNGLAYSPDVLKKAITLAKGANARPIELLVKRGDRYLTVPVDYHDGLRWPWLERAAPGIEPTGLDRLLSPRRVGGTL